ncbi:MAG: diacylglycerol kinase (ATP) [Bradymonadia bacterium]
MIALVANPAAASGRVGKRWDTFINSVRRHYPDVVVHRTTAHDGARSLGRLAVEQGATTILSLGGDGTHSQVVAGLMATNPQPGALSFGPLPAGTGSDFCRNYDCVGTVDATLAHHHTGATALDVAALSYTLDGEVKHTHFLNICSAGIGGLIDSHVSRAPTWINGRLKYFGALLLGTAQYETATVEVVVDGETKGEFPIHAVCICNGRWFAGGMQIAPNARVDDGRLEVIVLPPVSVLRALRLAPAAYGGRILEAPDVLHWPATRVQIIPVGQHPAYMDVDGEALGVAPCEATITPQALTLLGTIKE